MKEMIRKDLKYLDLSDDLIQDRVQCHKVIGIADPTKWVKAYFLLYLCIIRMLKVNKNKSMYWLECFIKTSYHIFQSKKCDKLLHITPSIVSDTVDVLLMTNWSWESSLKRSENSRRYREADDATIAWNVENPLGKKHFKKGISTHLLQCS